MSAHLRLVRKPHPPDRPPDAETAQTELLRGLHARNPAAERRLLDTHAARVERILFRILGDIRSLEDMVQEVFARIDDVREPEALKPFLTSVTVFVAREALRKKRRHRWLAFFASDELPEVAAGVDAEAREGGRAFYRALERDEILSTWLAEGDRWT